MVSMLLNSITDLLSMSGSEETREGQQNLKKKKEKKKTTVSKDGKTRPSTPTEKKSETSNVVGKKSSTVTESIPEVNKNLVDSKVTPQPPPTEVRKAKSKVKLNSSQQEYFNAETLDRAIVQRLQSKVSFNASKNGEDNHERRESGSTEKPILKNYKAFDANLLNGETLFPEVHVHGSGTRLNEKSVTDFNVLKDTTTTSFKSFVEQDSNTSLTSPAIAMNSGSENRGIVYKNAHFSLENGSRETLNSADGALKDKLSDTILNNHAMFGIPDPTLFTRAVPSISPSNESLRATARALGSTESVLGNMIPTSSYRKRSPSPGPSPSPLRSPLYTRNFTPSSPEMGEHLFEATMNSIIEKGGDEFKNKYSSWVWDAFRSHLNQLKSVLLAEFNQKMKETLEDREKEVMTLQQQYREKLSEFDVTTEGFQKMIDSLYQENQKVLKAKDTLIEKLKKEFFECKRHFEQDLVRQMQSYRKEAEVEKLELQKRNDELMMVMLTDASKSGLEEAFKREIESLHKMIKALTTQNEVLHQQLEEATSSAVIMNRKAIDAVQAQLEQAHREVSELRKKLQGAEREREDLTVSHHEEIAKLNRRIQETNTKYEHQLRDTTEELDNIRKRYQKESKDLKQRLQSQEAQYLQSLNQVKQQYGGQVESLSKAVSQLQHELTLNGSRRY